MVMIFGYFFICPADLLICICSCELYKLLTHPTLLQGCCSLLCSLSHKQQLNCERTVLCTHKIASPPRKTYYFCLQIHSVSDLQSWFSLVLCFRGFVSFTTSCSLGEQNHFFWSDSGLKQFTPVSSSLSVICYYPSPAISFFSAQLGFLICLFHGGAWEVQ